MVSDVAVGSIREVDRVVIPPDGYTTRAVEAGQLLAVELSREGREGVEDSAPREGREQAGLTFFKNKNLPHYHPLRGFLRFINNLNI